MNQGFDFTVYFLEIPVFFLVFFLYTLFKVLFSQSRRKNVLDHLTPTIAGPAGEPSEISHLRFFKTWQPCDTFFLWTLSKQFSYIINILF